MLYYRLGSFKYIHWYKYDHIKIHIGKYYVRTPNSNEGLKLTPCFTPKKIEHFSSLSQISAKIAVSYVLVKWRVPHKNIRIRNCLCLVTESSLHLMNLAMCIIITKIMWLPLLIKIWKTKRIHEWCMNEFRFV